MLQINYDNVKLEIDKINILTAAGAAEAFASNAIACKYIVVYVYLLLIFPNPIVSLFIGNPNILQGQAGDNNSYKKLINLQLFNISN